VLSETHTEDAYFYHIRVKQWLNLYDYIVNIMGLYSMNDPDKIKKAISTLDEKRSLMMSQNMIDIKHHIDGARSKLWSYTLLVAIMFNIIGCSNILKNIYKIKLKNVSHTNILFAYMTFIPFILFLTNKCLSTPAYMVVVVFSVAFIVSMMCTSSTQSKLMTNSFLTIGYISLMLIWNNFSQSRDSLIVQGTTTQHWQQASLKYIVVFGLALTLAGWNISANDPMPYMEMSNATIAKGTLAHLNQCKIKSAVNISLWCLVAILTPTIVVALLFLT